MLMIVNVKPVPYYCLHSSDLTTYFKYLNKEQSHFSNMVTRFYFN